MKQNHFSLSKRLNSFKYAFNGIAILLKEEHNSRIHFLATFIVIILGYVFDINSFEWISLIFSCCFVISMELINSSIENLSDFSSREKHILIKKAKDLAAGGVLFSAIAALAVGIIIFLPKIIQLAK
tara:strand:+ start:1427 stop:1807 length:381 start_codon:yes stop_codon:yes gene_type:complete